VTEVSTEAFYEPLGEDSYRSTHHTNGPWTQGSQHMGPPSALLTRQLERSAPGPDSVLARITVEILGPVPVAEVAVRSWVQRPGRSVQLAGAELVVDDRPVARAWAWWMGRTDTASVAGGLGERLPDVDPRQVRPDRPEGWLHGYLDAMEWVSVKGNFGDIGPATLWVRQKVALVDGEEPTGLQRLMAVADSGNGASNRLDMRNWLFINTELTVHLWRVPVGEWIGLDAETTIGPNGVGLANSTLHDSDGPVGRGAQALLVRPR
jgi:Thioesterase-like superfamily